MTSLEKNNLIEKIENYQEKTKNSLVTFLNTTIPIFFGFIIGIFPQIYEQISVSIALKIIFFIVCLLLVVAIFIAVHYLCFMITNAKKAKDAILNKDYVELVQIVQEDTNKENNYLKIIIKCFYLSLSLILIIIFILLFFKEHNMNNNTHNKTLKVESGIRLDGLDNVIGNRNTELIKLEANIQEISKKPQIKNIEEKQNSYIQTKENESISTLQTTTQDIEN
ncbi:MAG: hypothetical protein EKK61_04325 [Rickettsiales bacterium]|nr:MAG: hypothetical protein EKK61_04325 [Rickettsiales bacterium]